MGSHKNPQSLLEMLLDPSPNDQSRKHAPRKRRLRRCRSAPMGDPFLIDDKLSHSVSASHRDSRFLNIHPSLVKVIVCLLVYLGVGVICFYVIGSDITGAKTNGVVDALYFCVVTMTTVGYGDLVPHGVLAKLLACAFVFTGMALVALMLGKAADYLVEKQEAKLVKALRLRQKLGPAQIMREIETNRVKYKLILTMVALLVLMVIGTLFLVFVEKREVLNAFYCVCCTVTTLGYGDQSFSTMSGRIFAVFWILTSTVCLAQFFLYIAELNTERRQKDLVRWVLTRKVTNQDLEEADLDNDGRVQPAEFILYKLKEMGKICQEDLLMLMNEFEELDVDQSGTLSLSDIMSAQSGSVITIEDS